MRRLLLEGARTIPDDEIVGYQEIGGPKLGRDYSDKDLADQLRASLGYLKETWLGAEKTEGPAAKPAVRAGLRRVG